MTRSLIFQTSPVILKPFPAVASCGLLSQPLEAHQSSGLDLKHLGGLELQIRVECLFDSAIQFISLLISSGKSALCLCFQFSFVLIKHEN